MSDQKLRLAVQVLGYPTARWGNVTLKLPTQKSLAILSYLAVRGQPATRDELAELLWPPHAASNLRPELHRLRSLPGAHEWFELGVTAAVLADTDLAAFEQAVREERYQEALALHPPQEVLLRGFEAREAPAFGEWLELERRRVNTLLRDALRGRALELEQAGTWFEALALVRSLISFDSLDESAYRAAMRLEYKRGHVQAALQYFETCRRTLKGELDLEPLMETLDLAREIERGSVLPDIQLRTPKRRIPAKLLRPPVLVGREREWAQMEAAWEADQTIVISGLPGVGKTRLMMDFIKTKGEYVVDEGRPGDEHLPYSSCARSLRRLFTKFPEIEFESWIVQELSRILPELATSPVIARDQGRLYEAIYRAVRLFRGKFEGFAVDDVQYFDWASFTFGIWYSARLQSDAKVRERILICFRQGEVPPEYETELGRAVAAGGMIHINLEPLDEVAVRELLQSLDVVNAEHLTPRLNRLTGGNPLFIVETLKRLYETGEVANEVPDHLDLPRRVSVVLDGRLKTLSQPALRLIQTLAASQQTAEVDILAAVLKKTPFEIADLLTELEDAQILKNGSFVHDLLYEAVLAGTPTTVSKLLHRRIAEVLGQTGAERSRIAHHLQQAGEIERAVRHWLEAARAYQAAGLHDGALDLLRQVVTYAPDTRTCQEAQVNLTSSYLELGRYQEARNAALPLLHGPLSPQLEARALELMTLIHLGEGHLHEAATLAARSSELGEAVGDSQFRQRLRLLRARIAHRAERHEEALALLEPLLFALQQEPQSLSLATVLSEVGAMYDSLGRSSEALPLHYQALELSHQLEAPHHQVIASNHLVYCLIELGRPQDALAPGEAALALGHYRYSDLLRINLARAYLLLECYQDASRHYRHLCKHSSDPALCAAAWARLAEVYHHLHLSPKIKRALDRALKNLEATDFGRAVAAVAIVTLRYGTERQRERLRPQLSKLDIEALPNYQKDELKLLLSNFERS